MSSGNPYAMAGGAALMLGASLLGGNSDKKARRYNTGVHSVPGNGNTDSVPAMLTPGESVLTKAATERLGGRKFIEAANFGNMDALRLNKGGIVKPSSLGMKAPSKGMKASYTALEANRRDELSDSQKNIEGFSNKSQGTDMGGNNADREDNGMQVKYNAHIINNVQYVTAADFETGINQAITRSQTGMMKQMRSSTRTRRNMGI